MYKKNSATTITWTNKYAQKDAQTHWTEQQTDVGSTSTVVTRQKKKKNTHS